MDVPPEIDPARFEVRTASPRGFDQAYVREGVGGVPLLCVHGWPESKRIFWKVIEPFASVRPDPPYNVPPASRSSYAITPQSGTPGSFELRTPSRLRSLNTLIVSACGPVSASSARRSSGSMATRRVRWCEYVVWNIKMLVLGEFPARASLLGIGKTGASATVSGRPPTRGELIIGQQ